MATETPTPESDGGESDFSPSKLAVADNMCGGSQEKLPTSETVAGFSPGAAKPTLLEELINLASESIKPQTFSPAASQRATILEPFSTYLQQGFPSQTGTEDPLSYSSRLPDIPGFQEPIHSLFQEPIQSPTLPPELLQLLKKMQSEGPPFSGSLFPKSNIPSPLPDHILPGTLLSFEGTLDNTIPKQGSFGGNSKGSGSQDISSQNRSTHTPYHTPSQQARKYSRSHDIFDTMSYQGVQNQGQGQNHGQDQNFYNAQRGYSKNKAIQGPVRQNMSSVVQQQGAYNQKSSQQNNPGELSITLRARVEDLKQLFDNVQDIPTAFHDQIIQQIRGLIRDLDEHERQSRQDWEISAKERSTLETELSEAQKLLEESELQIQNLVVDRCKVSAERDALVLKMTSLSLKKGPGPTEAAESKWKEVNGNLLEKIRIQEEQLQGRRALWLEANPTSSARRDAMTALRDPFNSPPAHFTPRYVTQSMTSMGSPSLQSPSQVSFGSSSFYEAQNTSQSFGLLPQKQYHSGSQCKSFKRRLNLPNLPTGKAKPAPPPFSLTIFGNGSHPPTTEPGDDTPSMTLAVLPDTERLGADFEMALNNMFKLVDDWVRKYTNEPDLGNDRLIAASNQILWDFMLNCAYPGQHQDSHTHVVTLLNDPSTRSSFVMRMLSSYFIEKIMNEDSFLGFNSEIDRILNDAKAKLLERGLAMDPRQKLVSQKSKAIQSALSSPTYTEFRADKLREHTRALRDMMGPLLNNSAPRSGAGRDLGEIVIMAWELTCKMYTSDVSFQIFFPETASKFISATMKANDTNADPLQIQCDQTRVKLVITPVMTLRDDRGLTIKVRGIQKSTVLLMG